MTDSFFNKITKLTTLGMDLLQVF